MADPTGLTVNQSDYDVNFNLMEALVYYNPHSALERKHVNQALLAIVVRVGAPGHHKVIVLAEAMKLCACTAIFVAVGVALMVDIQTRSSL